MKSKNMTINNRMVIKVALLVIFTSLLPWANLSAQKKKLFYPNSTVPIEVGDSIKINPDSLHYETGERKVRWVYNQVHEVRQVSSKYHPDAILLKGINSWIYANSILPETEAKKMIYEPMNTSFEITIEDGEYYDWNGIVYNQTGDYVQKFLGVNEIDSIVTLHLTVKPKSIYTSFDITIDYGQTYSWNDSTYGETGTYTQHFLASNSADSIVTLNLVVRQKTIYTSFDITVKYGEVYTWNKKTYDSTGAYTQPFTAVNGADSIVTLNLTVEQKTQVDRFSVGVRGGFASSMAKPASFSLGGDVLLDLQYAHYWATSAEKFHLGLMTGISVGYMGTNRSQAWDETFVVSTSDGDVEYHVTADDITETSHQLQLELPIMFSMLTKGGLFFNVGPRFLLPAYTPYKQVITNGNVIATDLETGVVIPNNPVYGALSEQQENQKGKGNQQFDLTCTIGFELGYEFKLKSGNSIGLGGFLNYGVYSMFSNNTLGTAIGVTAPGGDQIGVVNVESLTNAYTQKMGHLDVGVKVAYNLNFIK